MNVTIPNATSTVIIISVVGVAVAIIIAVVGVISSKTDFKGGGWIAAIAVSVLIAVGVITPWVNSSSTNLSVAGVVSSVSDTGTEKILHIGGDAREVLVASVLDVVPGDNIKASGCSLQELSAYSNPDTPMSAGKTSRTTNFDCVGGVVTKVTEGAQS